MYHFSQGVVKYRIALKIKDEEDVIKVFIVSPSPRARSPKILHNMLINEPHP